MYVWKKITETDIAENDVLKGRDVAIVSVNGKKICLIRFEGAYYAVQPRCPHAGASLGDGWCTAQGHIVCPVHRMAFDIRTGRNAAGEGLYLETYPVALRADGLYIGIRKKKWWHFFC